MNVYYSDITPDPPKKHKKNPVGQDAFLRSDGSIEYDEDKIVAVQRRWKHAMYAPGGHMYTKVSENFYARQKYNEDHYSDPRPPHCSRSCYETPSPGEVL